MFRTKATAALAASLLIAGAAPVAAWTFENDLDLSIVGDPDDMIGTRIEPVTSLSYAVEPSQVVTDDAGNIYTIGLFRKAFDVDPTDVEDIRTPVETTTPGVYARTSYIAKFDANGDFQWFESMPNFYVTHIAVTPDGQRIWLAGETVSNIGGDDIGDVPADFDTGPGEALIDTGRLVAASYTADFEFESVTGFVRTNYEFVDDLTVGTSGNPTLAVSWTGGAVERIVAGSALVSDPSVPSCICTLVVQLDGDSSGTSFGAVTWTWQSDAPVTSLDSGPADDVIFSSDDLARAHDITRLSADGTLEWTVDIDTTNPNAGSPISGGFVVDDGDNVVAIVSIDGTLDVLGETIAPVPPAETAQVMLRIDPTGTVLSAEVIPGALGDSNRQRLTRTADAMYLTIIEYVQEGPVESYLSNILVKFSLDGSEQWRKRYAEFGARGFAAVTGIAPDRSGGVIRVGWMSGQLPPPSCTSLREPTVDLEQINYVLRTDEFGGIGPADTPEFSGETLTEIAVGGDNWVQIPTNCPAASIWEVSEGTLPEGLTLDPATGIISGEPTGTGAYSFTIRITNAAGTATRSFSGDVTNGSAPTWPDGTTFGPLAVLSPLSTTLRADGGPAPTYEVTSGSLPSGLTLDPRTGAVTGTPDSLESYEFKFTPTNLLGHRRAPRQQHHDDHPSWRWRWRRRRWCGDTDDHTDRDAAEHRRQHPDRAPRTRTHHRRTRSVDHTPPLRLTSVRRLARRHRRAGRRAHRTPARLGGWLTSNWDCP
ncbi:MAG: Ig domain-containing protein, partial [Ilumatobacteraceae bacterium]